MANRESDERYHHRIWFGFMSIFDSELARLNALFMVCILFFSMAAGQNAAERVWLFLIFTLGLIAVNGLMFLIAWATGDL